jgi:hypothetical protein
MKKIAKSEAEIKKEVESIHNEIQPALYEYNENFIDLKSYKDLNVKILKITMIIKNKFPELSKYIEEMPITIPDEKNPEITAENLRLYYNSLNSILNKYIKQHPVNK